MISFNNLENSVIVPIRLEAVGHQKHYGRDGEEEHSSPLQAPKPKYIGLRYVK
jgi:hypothetical protein